MSDCTCDQAAFAAATTAPELVRAQCSDHLSYIESMGRDDPRALLLASQENGGDSEEAKRSVSTLWTAVAAELRRRQREEVAP